MVYDITLTSSKIKIAPRIKETPRPLIAKYFLKKEFVTNLVTNTNIMHNKWNLIPGLFFSPISAFFIIRFKVGKEVITK